MGTLGVLDPTLFTATTCTEYSVNGVRPSRLSSVVFEAVVNTNGVFPLPSSTTSNVTSYLRIGALLSGGSSQDKEIDVVLACNCVITGLSGGPGGERNRDSKYWEEE